MSTANFKQGLNRAQSMLLPPSVEDFVGANNKVRAIDAYVDSLALSGLGFRHSEKVFSAGQPPYAPGDLFKLYLYGYLNRVRSSRRLEAECRRNLELIWLLGGLTPGYRTIAEFRKDNAKALQVACRDFVQLCRELDLLGAEVVAIDGSYFNADASDASVKTKAQLEVECAAIERDIERYQQQMDLNDAQERDLASEDSDLTEKLAALKARQARKAEQLQQLDDSNESQLSHTDPDARRLKKSGQKTTGYNVQNVVDAKHNLIITHEVTNASNDQGQLTPMAEAAKQTLEVDSLTVLADAGYYKEADIASCEQAHITAYVPIPDKHKRVSAQGRLSGRAFHYMADVDVYVCPGGQTLKPEGNPNSMNGKQQQRYRCERSTCQACVIRSACLGGKSPSRQVYRSEFADSSERHRERMQAATPQMRQRAATVEHPFGTLKRWMGWDHFLVRGFERVRGEMALLTHCYNLQRVLSIIGINRFIDLCRQRQVQRRCAIPAS